SPLPAVTSTTAVPSNARPRAPEKAGARHERRLFPVACRPLLGGHWHCMMPCALACLPLPTTVNQTTPTSCAPPPFPLRGGRARVLTVPLEGCASLPRLARDDTA